MCLIPMNVLVIDILGGIAEREYNKMKFKKLEYENIQNTSGQL